VGSTKTLWGSRSKFKARHKLNLLNSASLFVITLFPIVLNATLSAAKENPPGAVISRSGQIRLECDPKSGSICKQTLRKGGTSSVQHIPTLFSHISKESQTLFGQFDVQLLWAIRLLR
jgi:hypothetical protein